MRGEGVFEGKGVGAKESGMMKGIEEGLERGLRERF